MKFSLTHMQKTYMRLIHRDTLKRPYKPARDWYVLVVGISVCALLFNIGARMIVFQEQETGVRTASMYESYTLDIESMNDVIRLYAEKEEAYAQLLSEGLEVKDPAW